jgi:hypothetical protein
MSILGDVIRPFWLPGLNDISGIHVKGLGGWICDEEYQVYAPMTGTAFALNVASRGPLLEAYSADINRIAISSFETSNSIVQSSTFPRSTAWLVIKTYYAAFFAAHAFIRMLGASCLPLEREQINSLTRVADLYGNAPSTPMTGGLYHLTFQPRTNTLNGARVKSIAAGAHEAFWLIFHERVVKLSSEVLASGVDTLSNRQLASTKLSELASNLCFASSGKAHWLSVIRNSVNYNQKHSTWYPYTGHQSYYSQLFVKKSEWKATDPMNIDLMSHEGKELRRFQATCNFIIGMLRVSIAEMVRRCSGGRSFHTYGSVAFLNLLEQHSPTRLSN